MIDDIDMILIDMIDDIVDIVNNIINSWIILKLWNLHSLSQTNKNCIDVLRNQLWS